jgi:hypothetical protein
MIILRKPNGDEKRVMPGENYDASEGWEVAGVDNTAIGSVIFKDHQDAERLLVEIERELAVENTAMGDWIKRMAAPIARLIGKQNCLRCEVRRVMLNAAARLKEKHGEREGKRLLKSLLIRSYREPVETILRELKSHLL